jgi:uncharacterized protein YndB with AHSA1/START domain
MHRVTIAVGAITTFHCQNGGSSPQLRYLFFNHLCPSRNPEPMSSPTENPIAAPEFVITRVLDAPQGLVFKAWTEPDRLSQWWGPAGFQIQIRTFELKPGGLFHYSMRAPVGDMWGRFIFKEVVPSERIVFINSFSDPLGQVSRAPFNPQWPLEVLNTLTLTAQGNKTLMELRGGPVGATETEIRNFAAAFPSMKQGFGGTFDQLSVYLMLHRS